MKPRVIVRGDQELEVALDRVSGELVTIWQAGLRRAGGRIEKRQRSELQRHGKVDTRALLESIGTQVEGLGARIGPGKADNRETIRKYRAVIEFGRRPGSRMPPDAPIRAWARRHGMPEEAVFPLRRKIAERGLSGQPFPYVVPSLGMEMVGVMADLEAAIGTLEGVFDGSP